jgi:sugar-specific transcriptional regulator TrmB
MSNPEHIDALVALGMTPLEAAVYTHLIQFTSATGYRVARGIDKPTANTYKALASLHDKGAVALDDEKRRLYHAVPPDELLNALERRFMDHRRAAASGLAKLDSGHSDDRIYQLQTLEQVVERLRKMLSRCREVAVLDLSPWVVTRVAGELEFAASSGATVAVKVYEPTEIDGVRCVACDDDVALHNAQAANAVIDRHEMLMAVLDPEGAAVQRAIWTVHKDLAWVLHRSVVAEMLYAEVEGGLAKGLSTDELEDMFDTYRELRLQSGA